MSISSVNNVSFNPYQISPTHNSIAQDANLQPEKSPATEQNNFAIGEQNAAQSFKQDTNSEQQTSKQDLERQQDEETQQVLDQLKARDREVRTHEQAHLAAAGPYAKGGINYDYQAGPDGNKYAVGGNVEIDVSPISGDPAATIQKAQVVQKAALAPAEPSAQDRSVAAQASKMEAEARSELLAEELEKNSSNKTENADTNSANEAGVNPINPNSINAQETEQPGLVAASETTQTNQSEQDLLAGNLVGAEPVNPQNPAQGFAADISNPARNDFEIRLSLQA